MSRVFKRGSTYHIEYLDEAGKRIRESAKTRSEAKAEVLLKEAELEVAKKKFVPGEKNYKLRTILSAFHDYYERERKASTQAVAGRLKNYSIPRLGECKVNDLSVELLETFQDELLDKGLSPATVNQVLGDIRGALRHAKKRGKISRLPHVPMLKVENADTGKYASLETVNKICSHLDGWQKNLVLCSYFSGRRQGELRQLTWDMVNLEEKMVTWSTTKNGRALTLPLVGPLLEIILQQRSELKVVSPWVFHRDGKQLSKDDGRRSWSTATKAESVPGLRMHDLRVSAVTNLRRQGVDRQTSKSISGHQSDSVFERYSIIEVEDQRDALEETFDGFGYAPEASC